MTIKSRRKHNGAFKTEVVLEAVRGECTVAELAQLSKGCCSGKAIAWAAGISVR